MFSCFFDSKSYNKGHHSNHVRVATTKSRPIKNLRNSLILGINKLTTTKDSYTGKLIINSLAFGKFWPLEISV